MTISEFIKRLCQFLINNGEKCALLWQYKGGWEGWLQAELCINFPLGSVEREVAVWNDTKKCDLYFPKNGLVVELKCPGMGQAQMKIKNDSDTFKSTTGTDKAIFDRIVLDKGKVDAYANRTGKQAIAVAIIPRQDVYFNKIRARLVSLGYQFKKCGLFSIVAYVRG